MGFLDSLKNQLTSQVKREINKAGNQAANSVAKAVKQASNHKETFTFQELPKNLEELKALPEASLDNAYKTTALCVLALCQYETDEAATIEMLNFLKGPETVSEAEKIFLRDRLKGKGYKTLSFFKGATTQNNYQPTKPYSITVSENPYSFNEENWATLYLTSAGADTPRPVKLRKKPSTGQWFINDIQCLSDIRIPTEQDKWA